MILFRTDIVLQRNGRESRLLFVTGLISPYLQGDNQDILITLGCGCFDLALFTGDGKDLLHTETFERYSV
jgi:hypothetical protein